MDAHDPAGDVRTLLASRRNGAKTMQHMLGGSGDESRAEPASPEGSLRSHDGDCLLYRQHRARERVPSAAVQLNVPERRRNPQIARVNVRCSLARSNGFDELVAQLQLDP